MFALSHREQGENDREEIGSSIVDAEDRHGLHKTRDQFAPAICSFRVFNEQSFLLRNRAFSARSAATELPRRLTVHQARRHN
jgi:hypothetical protein